MEYKQPYYKATTGLAGLDTTPVTSAFRQAVVTPKASGTEPPLLLSDPQISSFRILTHKRTLKFPLQELLWVFQLSPCTHLSNIC